MRNLSVSAPSVTVRSQLPWPLRALLGFLVLAVAAAAGVAIYDYGRNLGGPDRKQLLSEIDRLQAQLREEMAERARYAAQATAHEAQLRVERAAQEQLMQQVAALEGEANRLREDLAFFESLLPTQAGANKGGVLIRSFRLQPEPEPQQFRYRLLVQQPGKPERDFVGSVQLQVNFAQGGRNFVLSLPGPAAPEELGLSFRHYQRVEGVFALPAGAVARSVLVKILAGDQTRVQQSFNVQQQ